LQTLVSQDGEEKDDENIEISAFVKSMSTGVQIPSDLDIKKYTLNNSQKNISN